MRLASLIGVLHVGRLEKLLDALLVHFAQGGVNCAHFLRGALSERHQDFLEDLHFIFALDGTLEHVHHNGQVKLEMR